jgi:hypothetical protein
MIAADASLVHAHTVEEDFFPVTPLHYAVDGRETEAARLVVRGVRRSSASERLLLLAARPGDLILCVCSSMPVQTRGRAPHLGPVEAGETAVARLLIDRGLDIDRVLPASRETFLTYACRGDKGAHPLTVRTLLGLGADVNGRNAQGRTALHQAARAGFTQVIEVLQAAGADADARDTAGATPGDLAIAAGRWQAAGVLGGARRQPAGAIWAGVRESTQPDGRGTAIRREAEGPSHEGPSG